MPAYRSRTVTHGRNMAGARALLRATGVEKDDLGRKPIIAVVNSYTQFVPGHTHLAPVGEIVAAAIKEAGGIPREFNTIAVDDGIAMGHGGMLYSLPSRDLIADSVEYMVQAHCADAMVCISNCDKITPGMLNAALRLNIPTVFRVRRPDGGRHGRARRRHRPQAHQPHHRHRRRGLERRERRGHRHHRENACPTCGSCSGMFTANSMNCLTEALGLSLPGNGSTLATHTARKELYEAAGRTVMDITRRYYEEDDASVLPRSVATRPAFENAMALDVAMGGSTNTVLHILAAAREAELDFTQHDIDQVSRRVPCLCKPAPNGDALMEDVHRAGGIPRHPRRVAPRRPAQRERHDGARPHRERVARRLGHPRRPGLGRGDRAVPRCPRLQALRDRLLAERTVGVARTPTLPTASSATASTRSPRTVDSRSSTATSPSAAAS